MRRSMVFASVAAVLMATAPGLVLAQPEGKGRDRGGEDRGPPGKGGDRDGGERRGGGPDRDRGGERRERDQNREGGEDRREWAERRDRDVERRVREVARPPAKKGDWERRDWNDDRRPVYRDDDRDRRLVWLRREPDRRLIEGCPPGLAKQNQWCLPPGQLRQIARARYERPRHDYVWRAYRDRGDYRYDRGYLYEYSPQGSLLGYLPVLGGALSLGSAWPGQYDFQPVPDYYSGYYGLNDRYDYRFADGVVYGVDPQTQAIQQVAALLTGQDWTVGQQMPAGYDVYNLPYGYRDRYVDGPDRWYRYDDGYVYQVDPTTRLVQTAIQLLT